MSLATFDHVAGSSSSGRDTLQAQPWRLLARRLGLASYHLLRQWSEAAAMRRARRELLELPDSMIADIGISRSEIPSVVKFGPVDPTRIPRGKARS